MARLNICGFETGDATEGTIVGTASIQSSIKRAGSYALRCNPTTTATGAIQINGISGTTGAAANYNAATIYARFYLYIAALPASGSEEIFQPRDTGGSMKGAVRVTSAGKLQAYANDGTTQLGSDGATTLTTGIWYRIEVSWATGAAAAYEVKINGASELSGTGNLGTTNNGLLRLGKGTNRNGQSVDYYFDDLAIDDAAYPGAGEIKILLPTGNGNNTAWTGTYADIDEVPHDSDTTFITSTLVNNDAETVALQDCATVGVTGTVGTVKTIAVARRDGAGNGAIKTRVRSGATDFDSTSNASTTASYTPFSRLLPTDPATSAAWTTGGVDALETGVVERSVSAASRATLICAMVEYVPSTATALLLRRRREFLK